MMAKIRRLYQFGKYSFMILAEILRSPRKTTGHLLKLFRNEGISGFWSRICYNYRLHFKSHESRRTSLISMRYPSWVELYDTIGPADEECIRSGILQLPALPRISIILSVLDPCIVYLQRTIQSIQGQLYPHWELCLVDCSTDPGTRAGLEACARSDQRIKLVPVSTKIELPAALNRALEAATGDFITRVDQEDELPRHCLYLLALELACHPDAGILYSDEDQVNDQGNRCDPHFKPDWDPVLILSQNYVGHLAAFRRSLVVRAGGFRSGFEGSLDYDLLLRVSELTSAERIRHIPHVLYHGRRLRDAAADARAEDPSAWHAGKRAIEEALVRRQTPGTVLRADGGPFYRVRYPLPRALPRVSIVIPTRDRLRLLSNCVQSILDRTSYPSYEILIVDNGSVEPKSLAWLKAIEANPRVRVLSLPGPFNYSYLNNRAADQATGELLALVNNDIEVMTEDWLGEMVSQIVRDGVGMVGAKLYYGDGRIQHAGVLLGIGGLAGHAYRFEPGDYCGYFGRAVLLQSYSAVTAACLLVRRSLFLEIGGLDEINLPIAFNDVDLCLRVRQKGYRIVWTPYAELVHLESASRGSDETPERRPSFHREVQYMQLKWDALMSCDPAWNPNLCLGRESPTLAFPPRIGKPWREPAPTSNDSA